MLGRRLAGIGAVVLATGCSSSSSSAPRVDDEDVNAADASTSTNDARVDTGSASTEDTSAPTDTLTCTASGGSCTAGSECCSGLQCILGKCGTCSSTYPVYCPRPGKSDGWCWSAGTVCSTTVTCPDGTNKSCSSTHLKYDCEKKACVCPDPAYPNYCKAHDEVPDGCWPSTTSCGTTTKCADDTLHACRSSVLKYDCTTQNCACPNAMYPNYCKAHDAVPDACWGPSTACSTTTKCPDGTLHACRSSSFTYDCTTNTCKCADPNYPVYCPALGDVPANCWSTGTICGSVANCSGTYKACTTSGYHYDCSKTSCVTDGTSGGGGGSTSCDSASCKSFSNCVPGYGCMTCFQWCEGNVCHDGGCSDPF